MKIERVLHPTDLTEDGHPAFCHALKLALTAPGELRLLHVAPNANEIRGADFPGVRATLADWGLLAPDSGGEAVAELGLGVKKIAVHGRDPAAAIAHRLEQRPADMVVLATEGRDGLPRWLRPAVAEPIARAVKAMTLFVPWKSAGFISCASGQPTLEHILVPVAHDPAPQLAVDAAAAVAQSLGCEHARITTLHVANSGRMPDTRLPSASPLTLERRMAEGDVVAAVARAAQDLPADLIVMTTKGREGILDALRGSTTERILRQSTCPVLAIPADR